MAAADKDKASDEVTVEGDVKPGDELVVEEPAAAGDALTGAGDPQGAALPVEGAPAEHPEPTPIAFVNQDNVTTPGTQITRAPSAIDGDMTENHHKADGDVVPGEVDGAAEPAPR